MPRRKILVVYGTRPELIKLAPLVRELERRSSAEVSVCSTGQHRELVHGIEKQFGIRPTHALRIMKKNQSLSDVVAKLSAVVPAMLRNIAPDYVVVQGDTITACTVGFLAFLERIKVAHVEAGLRTFDAENPFPEEVSRRMLSQIASLHFAPTKGAAMNLMAEGIPKRAIRITGNTVVDAMAWSKDQPVSRRTSKLLDLTKGRPFVLLTMHRRESFGAPLRRVCEAIAEFTSSSNMHVVWPLHKNPHVEAVVRKILGSHDRIHLIDALDYVEFSQLLRACRFVVSDSGGVQEEAPYSGKPLLILREKTERPECVDCGSALLVGTDRAEIVKRMKLLEKNSSHFRTMSRVRKPFGTGNVSEKIADVLTSIRS